MEPLPIQIFGVDWVQSLDDTPGKFTSSQTKEIPLRFNLRSYLESYRRQVPSYSREQLETLIPANELKFFQCFDLALDSDGDLYFRFLLEYDDLWSSACDEATGTMKSSEEDLTFVRWLLRSYPGNERQCPIALSRKQVRRAAEIRHNVFKAYQARAFSQLSDSVSFWIAYIDFD